MNAFRARQQAEGRIDLLPPEPKAPARRHGQRFPARLETVDADFVVIRGGAGRTSNDNHRKTRRTETRPLSQHLAFRLLAAGARLLEAGLQRLPRRAFAALTAGTFLFVFAYAGGLSALTAAVTGAGETLRIAGVSASLDDRNGMKVLSVYGRVDNTGNDTLRLPPLEIRVEGTAGIVQRRLALEARTVVAGGSEAFALHIPHGGGKVPKVSVSFVGEDAPAI